MIRSVKDIKNEIEIMKISAECVLEKITCDKCPLFKETRSCSEILYEAANKILEQEDTHDQEC